MENTLHLKTTVLPGHRIEITAPQLPEGESIDVFLIVSETSEKSRESALDIIRKLKGHRIFQSPAEVDNYLQEERDTWDHNLSQ